MESNFAAIFFMINQKGFSLIVVNLGVLNALSISFYFKFFISEENVIHYYVNKLHGKATRWLNCVQVKAGIPYTTLVAILFLSLLMMAWICCSTCEDDDEDDDDEEEVVQKVFFSHFPFFDKTYP